MAIDGILEVDPMPSRELVNAQGPVHTQVLKKHDWVRISLARPSLRLDVMITPRQRFHHVVGASPMSMQSQRRSGATSNSA